MNHAAKVLEALAMYLWVSEIFLDTKFLTYFPIQEVVNLFSDIRLAFGESDEYSFVLHKGTTLYGKSSQFLCCSIITLEVCCTDSDKLWRCAVRHAVKLFWSVPQGGAAPS